MKVGNIQIATLLKIVKIIQLTLTIVLLIVIIQILTAPFYSTNLLFLSTVLSYSLSVFMMGLLASRFFSWFKSYKNMVILFYGLAASSLVVNTGVIFAISMSILPDAPAQVGEHVANLARILIEPMQVTLVNLNTGSSILSFFLIWCATSLLLHQHARKIGRAKYWIIVSLPLVYFISQFPTTFLRIFAELLVSNPALYGIILTVIFFLSKTVGGIFFGIAFWTVSRYLSHDNPARKYMVMSFFGLVLFFVSNQAFTVLINLPYPPFGLPTIMFTGLSSYLVFVGIYSSAISVAGDSKLRQSVKKFAMDEVKFLGSIGTAQMEEDLQKRVMTLVKAQANKFLSESGVSSSLSDEDVKEYLGEVLAEIRKP